MNSRNQMTIVPEEVRMKIEDLLHTSFHVHIKDVLTEGVDCPFFGIHGLLNPRELTYLTYLLEINYDIKFNEDNYDDPMFYSVDGLSAIVAHLVKGKI